MKILGENGVLSLVTYTILHFAGLKFMSKSSSYLSSLQRFSCKMFASDRKLRHSPIALSSAKSLTLGLTCSRMSFICARKMMAPSTEPCGTTEKTGIIIEVVP